MGRRKQKVKRHHLKRYSATQTFGGRQSPKGGSNVDFGSHLNMIGNARVMSEEEIYWRQRQDDWIDKTIARTFGQRALRALEPSRHQHMDNGARPIAWRIVQETIESLKGKSYGLNRRITLKDFPHWRLELFYSSNGKQWVFLEFDVLAGFIRRSIKYASRERAYKVLERKSITWKVETPIPT